MNKLSLLICFHHIVSFLKKTSSFILLTVAMHNKLDKFFSQIFTYSQKKEKWKTSRLKWQKETVAIQTDIWILKTLCSKEEGYMIDSLLIKQKQIAGSKQTLAWKITLSRTLRWPPHLKVNLINGLLRTHS